MKPEHTICLWFEGDPLTVEFTVLDIPCLGLNGGPEFKHRNGL
jgi:hypothetical protein